MDYLHNKIDIIEYDGIEKFISLLKNKTNNILFMTEFEEYKNVMNKKLNEMNLPEKCYFTDNITDMIKNINNKMILIGNCNSHKYDMRLDFEMKKQMVIININNYNIEYIDKGAMFGSFDKLLNSIKSNKKNICEIFDKTNTYERIQMMIEDKNDDITI